MGIGDRLDIGGYGSLISALQRADLDDQGLRVPANELQSSLKLAPAVTEDVPIWLVEITGISRFWQSGTQPLSEFKYFTQDILVGLNGQGIPLYFLLVGHQNEVRMYVGTMNEKDGASIRSLFESHYPGISLWPEREMGGSYPDEEQRRIEEQWKSQRSRLQNIRRFLNDCPHIGLVTGLPTPKSGRTDTTESQIDRLIRGLYGREWAYLVMATPEKDAVLVEIQLSFLKERMRVEQEEGFRETRERAVHSLAAYYHQLLEMQQQIVEGCLYEGGWWLQSYICSPDAAVYPLAKSLIKSVFNGDYSRVERIRVSDAPGAGPKAASFSPIVWERPPILSFLISPNMPALLKYHTLVSSGQLSALIHLPRQEMPGYFVRDISTFDVSSHVPTTESRTLNIGEILDRGRPTGNSYVVRPDDLTKHCLVVGLTGSGKTKTIFYLLGQLHQQEKPIPFLVIEPAKREYRDLTNMLPPGRRLTVFTVGEESENSAPFRLNPFEIRYGVSVQTHIDLLKSVFNASFGMWAPLPQVLERALHEVYREKGWNTVSGRNERAIQTGTDEKEWHSLSQPTLTDLYHKVGRLIPKLGYDKEIASNIQTALETRINSLRVGAKGLMLDTASSIPVESLLREPTVIELEGVGDDDEKAFIMGLLFMNLYEYYRWKGQPTDSGLLHITVIEEAHRLLTHVPPQASLESGNSKGKAVDTIVSLLSEIRAYGEGFVIADQIPTRLAPDVIKNTALKIMHRIVARDDRETMSGAMNLTEPQARQVVSLKPGEAIVHGGGRYGDDNAMLVKVPLQAMRKEEGPAERSVRRAWKRFVQDSNARSAFLPHPTCSANCRPLNPGCSDARSLADDKAIYAAFSSWILSLAAGDDEEIEPARMKSWLHEVAGKTIAAIRSCITGASESPEQRRCIITHLSYRFMDDHGRQYDWDYSDVQKLTELILPLLLDSASGDPGEDLWEGLRAFRELYSTKSRLSFLPFYGCDVVCGDPPVCLYRYSMEPLITDAVLSEKFTDAKADFEQLAGACVEVAEQIVMIPHVRDPEDDPIRKAALCYAVQRMHADVWPLKDRSFVMGELDALVRSRAERGEE